MIDPRKLRPSEFCRLLNSTPLGEVINEHQLRRYRTKAGLRIGDSGHVDLVRWVAWLVQVRHTTKPEPAPAVATDLAEAAQGAAALGSRWNQMGGHGQKLTCKQEALIAALLTEPNHGAAAAKAGGKQRFTAGCVCRDFVLLTAGLGANWSRGLLGGFRPPRARPSRRC